MYSCDHFVEPRFRLGNIHETHTRPAMEAMAGLLRQDRAPSELVARVAADDARRGPYAPCPCGSGKKFRFRHGNSAPHPIQWPRGSLAQARRLR
jgi:sulfatase maturation enzyme AslB (radical SAM superfamily)